MDINEQVFAVFAEATKPLKAGEVADITGLDKADVSKAVKELKKADRIESPKACFYQVKA